MSGLVGWILHRAARLGRPFDCVSISISIHFSSCLLLEETTFIYLCDCSFRRVELKISQSDGQAEGGYKCYGGAGEVERPTP